MLLEKFDSLIHEYPDEADTAERLLVLLKTAKPRSEYTVDRLFDQIKPKSSYLFTQFLDSAVQLGVLSRVFRVESPAQGGIGDFLSYLDVPPVIYDWRQDIDISVLPKNVEPIFKPVEFESVH